jgi:ribose-phosphate pyrophosphokinase
MPRQIGQRRSLHGHRTPTNKMKVFSGTASIALTNEICADLKIQPGKVKYEKFKNDNTFCSIEENVRECDIFLVQTSVRPVNDNLMEALIMIDALVRASARRITMVMPYFAYARSDKKDRPRIPITASLVARLLETAGADRLLTMDLHAEQIQGFFSVPVDHLVALPIIAGYLRKKNIRKPVIVAPDAGSARRSGAYAERLKFPLAIIDKRRDKITGKLKIHGVVGVVTNTVPIFDFGKKNKVKVLSVAPLFARAIHSIHTGTSVSKHFK